MQHFDMESNVFERGRSLLYIFVKKLFFTFLTFSLIFAYNSLSATDNMVLFYMDAHICISGLYFPTKLAVEIRD